jgi:hypothetical protein
MGFVEREWSGEPFSDLNLAGLHYNPHQQQWQRIDDDLRDLYLPAKEADPRWLDQAQQVIQNQRLPAAWLERLRDKYPNNPWSPYPLSPAELDDLVPWLFSGTPYFVEDNQDLPTPSRTMTVSWLIEQAVSDVEQQVPENEADVIYGDGDEFLVVCPAEMAPHLARRISRHVLSRLNAVPEDRVEQLSDFLPVTLAMGVVAAKRKHPMYGLLTLVDRLVQSAKTDRAKGTAIDFENVVGGVDEEYLNRETFGEEWLSERPLPLRQFGVLMEDVEKLREGEFSDEDKFPARQLQQIAALIADVPPPRADRRSAALAYVWQPHEGEGWENVRRACEDGTFQDLMTLWRWPQQVKEEEEDN